MKIADTNLSGQASDTLTNAGSTGLPPCSRCWQAVSTSSSRRYTLKSRGYVKEILFCCGFHLSDAVRPHGGNDYAPTTRIIVGGHSGQYGSYRPVGNHTHALDISFFGPSAGEVETIGPLDLTAQIAELALIACQFILLRSSHNQMTSTERS